MKNQEKRDYFVVIVSCLFFSFVRIVYSLFSINWERYQNERGIPNIVVGIDFLVFFVLLALFIIFGWNVRRTFIKNKQDISDTILQKEVKLFLTLYIPVLLTFFIISFINNIDPRLLYSVSIVSETIQLMFLGTLIGTLFYNGIDKLFLKLFKFKNYQSLQSQELSFVEQSIYKTVNRFWNYGLYILLFFMFLANLLVLIIYPSIPAEYNSGIRLIFAYPNFSFKFNPETGFRQEFFQYVEFNYSKMLNWKLLQSLLSIFFILTIFLLYYLPLIEKRRIEKESEENIINKEEEKGEKEKNQNENLSKDEVNSNSKERTLEHETDAILSFNTEDSFYSPKGLIKQKKTRFHSFIEKLNKTDIVPVMNLAALNLGISIIIIYFVQLFVPLIPSNYSISDILYIQLSSLYWAGLVEEISFRFLVLGLPLFIIHGIHYLITKLIQLIRKKTENNSSLNEVRVKKPLNNPLLYLTGRWKKASVIDILFIVASSFFFGYVHYQFGSWDLWKIFQAGVGGLIFGYAFYKYGFHAAVFLHTVNDFTIGLMIVPNLGLMVQGGYIVGSLIITGILYSFYLLYKFLKKFGSFSFKKVNKAKEVI